MRTCYGLLRLLFHSLELTFVFTGLLQHAHMLQIAYVSQSLGLNTPKTVMFHILELTFVFPGLLQHAHMLQIAKTYVPQSLGLKAPKTVIRLSFISLAPGPHAWGWLDY